MKLRTIASVGVMSIAGLGLIGTGAHAVFTQNTTSSQSIQAGTMNVVLSSPTATAGNNTANLTLPSTGPTPSTFTTAPELITINNNSNIPVNEVALQLSDTNNNSTLQAETWACFYSDGSILFNEPLTTVEGYGQAAVLGTIPAGGTDSYTVVFYAGRTENTGCGAAFTGFQLKPYGGFPGAYYSSESYPQSPGTNASAASLTNPAQGGSLTPTVTLSYTG